MATEAPFSAVVKAATDQLSRSLYDLGAIVSTSIEKTGTAATDQIVGVLSNGINATLGQIKGVLSGVINVNAFYQDGESDVYKGFSGTLTGTTALTVWTANTNKRWMLKGYAITGIVGDTAIPAIATGPLLYLADGGMSDGVVAPVAVFAKNAAAETSVFAGAGVGYPVQVNLGSGRRGSAADTTGPLKLMTDISLGAGEIKVVGVVWGREVANVG